MIRYRVADVEDAELLVLEPLQRRALGEPAPDGELRLVPDDGPQRRVLEALDALMLGRDPAHQRLLSALVHPEQLPELPRIAAEAGPGESARQREAIAMALASPDIALVHGPPGTGKTTVICELVRRFVRDGLRVLLVAPTHVALDNVLERVGAEPGVIAVRLGHADQADTRVARFLLPRRAANLGDELARGLERASGGAPEGDLTAQVQRRLRKRITEDPEAMGALLLRHANLVCATPIGLAQPAALRAVETLFDVLIIDEASKATLTDFLVPAARARKWILVGDAKQLPPYVDTEELAAVVDSRVAGGRDEEELVPPYPEWTGDIAIALRRHFDARMHPDPKRREKEWTRLREIVLRAFDLGEEATGILLETSDDARAWRTLLRDLREHPPPVEPEEREQLERSVRLTAELLELRAVALTGVFEHLLSLSPSRQVRLDHQFRMAPALAAWSRDRVYEGEYASAAGTRDRGLSIPTLEEPSIWLDTSFVPPAKRHEQPRDQERKDVSYGNDLEAAVACEVVERCAEWAAHGWNGTRRVEDRNEPAPFEIGVVCFYQGQAFRVRDRLLPMLVADADRWRRPHKLRAANGAAIEVHVSVVDRFQGREKDVVVLCTTRSNKDAIRGHVDNLNRLNVAATRARHKRIVIGDATTLAGEHGGRRRRDDDLLRTLYLGSQRKTKWGKSLVSGGEP